MVPSDMPWGTPAAAAADEDDDDADDWAAADIVGRRPREVVVDRQVLKGGYARTKETAWRGDEG